MALALGCLCAFLIGAVPWALIVVRLVKGIDIRTMGSGNVGATNATRAFSTKTGQILAFLAIYLLDAAKGFAPAFWGPSLLGANPPIAAGVWLALAAVLGHVFTPFLFFRGGKGVATASGALLALDPIATALAIGVFFAVRLLSGQVFWGSLALGVALAVAAIALHPEDAFAARFPVTILCLFLAAFLFWTHRTNLREHFASSAATRP